MLFKKCKRLQLGLVVLLLSCILISCAGRPSHTTITEFAQTTEQGVEVISDYYTQLNDYELELYLEERALNPKLEVLKTDAKGNRTPLFGPQFDPKGIQARVRLLKQLENYCTQLASLSSGREEKAFKTQMAALSANLTQVKDRLDSLSGQGGGDQDLKKYVNPIGTIVGIIGQALVERKREKAIRKVILENAASIDSVLDFLQKDIETFVDPTRIAGEQIRLLLWVEYYNDNKGKLTVEQRRETLAKIEQIVAKTSLLSRAKPSHIVGTLREAHAALVDATKASETGAAAGNFFALLQEYKSEIQELIAATKELSNL